MSAPAGWYPDPQDAPAGTPPQQRWWDGQAWTAHVAPGEQQQPVQQPVQQSVQQQEYPAYSAYPAHDTGAGYAPANQYVTPGVPTTPDGAPLAGWWHRVGAALIDGLILSVVVGLAAWPFVQDIITSFGDFFDEAMTAADNGDPQPSTAQFQDDVVGATLGISAISFVVSLVYTVAFLMWKQATPGKLAVGLRVRLRESPDLPLGTVLVRWLTQTGGPALLGLLPVLGMLSGLFRLLDVLWPLWDGKRQAIHDKVAKTNVVRTR